MINKFKLILVFVFIGSHMLSSQETDNDKVLKDSVQYKGEEVPKPQLYFFNNPRTKIKPKFELLNCGEIHPIGWIYDIMKQDISSGFVGALDELAPDILKNDDLFNTTRRNNTTDIPDVGDHELTGAAWEISMQWWSGETKGVWWEGYIRHAFLTDYKPAIKRSHKIIKYLLSTQDEVGYIGKYGKNRRYNHKGSNGELWTQTSVFKAMLAYYEFTNDEKILKAVERAMSVSMEYYGTQGKSPFNLGEPTYGGFSHGLMLTDVCDRLFSITGKQEYQDYAVYLYQEFSRYRINRGMEDMRYENLMNKDEFLSILMNI